MVLLKAEWFPFFYSPHRAGVQNEIISCRIKFIKYERYFWNKKGEYAVFFEIAKSKIEVKEKFKLFEHVVIISIVEYDLFLEPLTVQFFMSAYNVNGQVIFCESQPTIVNNTLDLIDKLENYRKQEYLTVDWKYIQ